MQQRRGVRAVLVGWGALFVALLALVIECHRPVVATASAPEVVAGRAPAAFASDGTSGLPEARAASPGVRRVEASGEACVLSGIVLGLDGRPARGVEVAAIPAAAALARDDEESPRDDEVHALTDEDGEFRLEVGPGDYSLSGYFTDGQEEQATEVIDPIALRPGEGLAGLELHLRPGLAIAGRLLGLDGDSPSGIEVCARVHAGDTSCVSRANADEEGNFTLTGVPAHAVILVAQQGARVAMTAAAPPARGIELRFPPQPVVTGRVLDEAGAPAPGTSVTVESEHGIAMVTADEEGAFRVALDAGGEVTVSARGEAGATEPVRMAIAAARDLVLALRPGATLVGRVVVAGSGEPFIDGDVELFDGQRPVATAPLDAAGEYRVEHLLAGRFRIAPSSTRIASPPSVEAVVGAGGEVRAADLRVARGRLLRGRVVDESGQPVEGAEVDVLPASGGFVPTAAGETGPDGAFTLPGRYAGTIALRASASGRIGERAEASERPGVDEQVVELRVSPEAWVSGVVRGPEGAPRSGARVSCAGSERTTSGAGRFSLSCPLSTGALRVDDGATREVPIALRPDGEVFVEVRL